MIDRINSTYSSFAFELNQHNTVSVIVNVNFTKQTNNQNSGGMKHLILVGASVSSIQHKAGGNRIIIIVERCYVNSVQHEEK